MIELGNILRAAGLTVVEQPGWRTAGHPGTFAPAGIVWHHTGGLNALPVVVNGRADLAGPLANLYLDHTGTFTVVCAGVAWHAGPGSQHVLDDIRNGVPPAGDAAALGLPDDCSDGNHYLLGIEVENLGTADDPYPKAQIDALVAGSAALCRALGFDQTHCVHHREWTARKVDMSYRGDLRGQVAHQLNPEPEENAVALSDEALKQIVDKIAPLIKASQDVIITHIRPAVIAEVDKKTAEIEAALTGKVTGA